MRVESKFQLAELVIIYQSEWVWLSVWNGTLWNGKEPLSIILGQQPYNRTVFGKPGYMVIPAWLKLDESKWHNPKEAE